MKTSMIWMIVMILIALGTVGCSSPAVWYWGKKAYARNPETGKWMSWPHIESEGRGFYGRRRYGCYSPFGGFGSMTISPKIDCSGIQVPCSIK